MTALTFPLPSGRGTRPVGVMQFLSDLVYGVREGHALAVRYDVLSHKSDAELARIGLRREDVPRAVFAGKKRAR